MLHKSTRIKLVKGKINHLISNHPIHVASLLANEAEEKDPVLFAAAILHDVVEDTVETKEEKQKLIDQIKKIFGEQVLALVLEVTDDKSIEKMERKRLQVENASQLSERAKKLKIADKISNIQDITDNPPTWWSSQRVLDYFDWAERVVAGLKGVNKSLESIFDVSLMNGRVKYDNNLQV